MSAHAPVVGVVMGSASDWETVEAAAEVLEYFEIPWERGVFSAHRLPDEMSRYGTSARERGLKVLIACAGGAAHLPGMLASKTTLPVIGVPRALDVLDGVDSTYSMLQMPKGVPLATMAIGRPGAANAGVLAARILGTYDEAMQRRLTDYQDSLRDQALAQPDPAGSDGYKSKWGSVIRASQFGTYSQ